MAVHSTPLRNGEPEPERRASYKDSAVVSRARLRRQRGAIERYSAIVLLFVSFAGTIAALSGGWAALFSDPHITPIVGGLVTQAVLTHLQWHYFDKPHISRPSRVADAVLTALGYGPLLHTGLMGILATRGIPEPWYAAWAIIGLASYLLAWYPESRLVD